MATEAELAPLEGAALSPISFESVLPPALLSSLPNANVGRDFENRMQRWDLARSRKLLGLSNIYCRCVRFYVPGIHGSSGAELGRGGQAGATAENDALPLRGAPCNCGMLCDDCAEV